MRNTRTAEPTIMEQVLHGNELGKVAEERDHVAGAIIRGCIAQWTHRFGKVEQACEALDPTTCGCLARTLAHGVHADLLLTSQMVSP